MLALKWSRRSNEPAPKPVPSDKQSRRRGGLRPSNATLGNSTSKGGTHVPVHGGRGCARLCRVLGDDGHAAVTRGPSVPAASSAIITNCFKMAERIVPWMRGRSAWVVRHADHCVRRGGSL